MQDCVDQVNLFPGTDPARGALALALAGLQDNKRHIDIFWRPGKPFTSDELLTVLVHEASHLLQTKLGWNFGQPGVSPLRLMLAGAFAKPSFCERWKAAVAKDNYAPSNYAIKGGHIEDFPEARVLYLATLGTPMAPFMRKSYPARSALLDELFPKTAT